MPTLVAILVLIGCGATGDEAIEAMSAVEQAFVHDELSRIERGMSPREVEAILGEPYRGAGTGRPVWLGPEGGERSQIAVYFRDQTAFRVRWMKLGAFVWESDLRPRGS